MKEKSIVPGANHRLVIRQINKAFPNGRISRDGIQQFIRYVNDSYAYFDQERELNRRAERISSQELQEAIDRLKEQNDFLDSFNHGLAHDVKNHSANLQGLIKMLRKYQKQDDLKMIKLITEKLDVSVNQMTSILSGFLYLSSTEPSDHSNFCPIKEKELIAQVEEEIRYLKKEGEPKINYQLRVSGLHYSEHILRIILVNLISNSIKFAHPKRKPNILALIEASANTLMIKVEDNGLGMDLKDPDSRIFRMFGPVGKKSAKFGHGIGLFMIKKILERNKGEIDVESELGNGTTFTIKLPLNVSDERLLR